LPKANNGLPANAARPVVLSVEFTFQHTQKVLKGEAKADVLIEINTSVLRGLAGQGAAA
jgi:flagellar biosynthesis activator protein FlaF